MTLLERVRKLDGMRMVDEDGKESQLRLLPPILDADLAALWEALPFPLPFEVEELLRYSEGFENGPLDTCTFWGFPGDFGMEEILPYAAPIAHDGYGNYWLLDLTPDSITWGPMLFCCHDPAVIVYQADNLAEFLDQAVELANPPHKGPIDEVHEQHAMRIWRENPGVLTAAQCKESGDDELKAFAKTLSDGFQIVDLRNAKLGDGFSWGRYGPRTVVRRHGHRRIFAYQPRSWLQRLFGR